MKTFIGDCVGNPFRNIDKLSRVIDEARQITRRTFLKHCDVGEELKKQTLEYPHDFSYWQFQNRIYFFTHSCIEHFFK